MSIFENAFLICLMILPVLLNAQSNREFLTEKPGKWTYYNNINQCPPAFDKNVRSTAEWFHHEVPIMANIKGFDLSVMVFGTYDEHYKRHAANYAKRCQLNFDFQLFLKDNGKESKWVVEPPHWSIYINNTETGHGSNFSEEGYKVQVDDPSLEVSLEKARDDLNELFSVAAVDREIAPGVHLLADGNVILFNPQRPAFWIPVTVSEVVALKLAYLKIRQGALDRQVYDYVLKMYNDLSAEEKNAPACLGSEDGILNVNGKNNGPQIMRFNKDYWDRSLPSSAIQFITLWYSPEDKDAMQEFLKNNGHPDYAQLVRNSLPLARITELIQKN